MPPPPDPDEGPADGVAPDGSPVEVYLRLGAGHTPALIDAAIPLGSTVLELGSVCRARALGWSGVDRTLRALVDAAVTYEVDGNTWMQRFSAEILDDEQLVAEAAEAGLDFDAWLDPVEKWAKLSVPNGTSREASHPKNVGCHPWYPRWYPRGYHP